MLKDCSATTERNKRESGLYERINTKKSRLLLIMMMMMMMMMMELQNCETKIKGNTGVVCKPRN